MKKTLFAIISLLVMCLAVNALTFEPPRDPRRARIHHRPLMRHNHPNPHRFYPRTCPACGEIARHHRARRAHAAPYHRRYYRGAPARGYRHAPARSYRRAPGRSYRNAPARSYRNAPAKSYRNAPARSYRNAPASNYDAPRQGNSYAPRQGNRPAPRQTQRRPAPTR